MHLQKRADVRPLPHPPIVVNASGTFDGNDGKWSTFVINVNSDDSGNDGQNFKALISTSSSVTLVPAKNEWCDMDCAERRGVQPYDGKQPLGVESQNWQMSGIYNIPLPYWYSAVVPGDAPNGTWGLSNVGLGPTSADSPVLAERYVVQYTIDDFFMASFGLAVGEVGPDSATRATFLSSLEDSGSVASSSYGYTAGAYYRTNMLGSLVLGGYDKSRMTDKSISMSMPNPKNNTLLVGVQSIIYTPDQDVASDGHAFTSGGFLANIDSTLPYLVLPENICDNFQEKFQLTYDDNRDLYTVNSSSHAANIQQNATVTFKIGVGARDSDEFANIELPYAAFDQQIGTRTGENMTNYFPIKKSKDGVYTLGRTFLQEAYIIVDYERANFTVAPAHYSDPMPKANVITILNQTWVPGDSTNTSGTGDSGGGLAPGAIAGTVVGIVIAFVIAGIIAFCWWRKRKDKKEAIRKTQEASEIDTGLAGNEIKYRRVSELTGSDLPSSPKTAVGGYYSTDHKSIPPISEMSPDSPPVELYSPPPESASDLDGARDYFTAGKVRRRGAQRDRDSSGQNTPGTPIAELPGDEGQFQTPGTHFEPVSPLNSPLHSRGPSDTSLSTNIDERLADHKQGANRPVHPAEAVATGEEVGPKDEAQPEATTEISRDRRPSHTRGLSDNTIASDSTAVSQPTPEEQERWAKEPRRPLSE